MNNAFPFFSVLTIALIVLKLTNTIAWSWWWIIFVAFTPLIIVAGFFVVAAIVLVVKESKK